MIKPMKFECTLAFDAADDTYAVVLEISGILKEDTAHGIARWLKGVLLEHVDEVSRPEHMQ